MEWPIAAGDDPAAIARLITGATRTFAVPLWDEFASVKALLARYDAGDRRSRQGRPTGS